MLEVAADDRAHPHGLGQPLDARLQAAHRAHHEVDRHAGPRGLVQPLDDAGVDQVVDLEDDPSGRPGLGLLADQVEEALAQGARRDQHLAIAPLVRVAGEVVEQVGDVGGQLGVGREEPDVLVAPRRDRVVVARPDMAVAADQPCFGADDEDGLGVGLQSDDAVDDVHAGLLQPPRPPDVRLLVAARLQLDQRDHLLAGLGGLHERLHDRALLVGRPVERLLDREHVAVVRGLAHELLDRGRERVVRVLDEHVARPEHLEDVGRRTFRRGEARLGDADPRLRLQRRPPQLRQGLQVAEVEQAVRDVDVGALQVELALQQRAHLLRHRRVDLEPHRLRRAAAAQQFGAERREQVLGLVDLDLDVGVAGDPEDVERLDLHAREEQIEVRRNHLLDGHEAPAARDLEKARQERRHLDASEAGLAGQRIARDHGQVEREVGDVRERMRRIDGERRQHREDPVLEHLGQLGVLRRLELVPVDDPHTRGAELLAQIGGEDAGGTDRQLLDARADGVELLTRAEPVRRGRGQPGRRLLPEPGDADLEELVEEAAEEGEEVDALEQRLGVVGGEREHTLVEVEPRELAVQVDRLGPGRLLDLVMGFRPRHSASDL